MLGSLDDPPSFKRGDVALHGLASLPVLPRFMRFINHRHICWNFAQIKIYFEERIHAFSWYSVGSIPRTLEKRGITIALTHCVRVPQGLGVPA